jgi:hypothetical protein
MNTFDRKFLLKIVDLRATDIKKNIKKGSKKMEVKEISF